MKWMLLLLHEPKEVWEEKEALEKTRYMFERNVFCSEGLELRSPVMILTLCSRGSKGQCGKS